MRPNRLSLCLALALLASSVFAEEGTATSTESAAAATSAEVSAEDIRAFVSVFRAIQEAYVEPVDGKRLMNAAIRGMLNDLDPHSAYLEADQLKQWDEDISGLYGGLGVEVIFMDGALRVIATLDDSPAQRGGIKSGDIIAAINGVAIDPNDYDSADRLRGNPGSKITLTIERDSQPEPIELKLVREEIRSQSLRARWLEPGFVYLRLSQFQESSPQELRDRWRKLVGKKPVFGVVLDLRNNPGGVLAAAVEISDSFLESGVIVTTEGRYADGNMSFSAKAGDLAQGAPMAVLIDQGSASAAEIVAGALQDHRRAIVVGYPSFGKGSVQNMLPLESGAAVKLTTARYYTPNHRSIQAHGIDPDLLLGDVQLTPADRAASLIESEASLDGHLEAELAPSENIDRDPELDHDYALSQAMAAIKALAFQKRAP